MRHANLSVRTDVCAERIRRINAIDERGRILNVSGLVVDVGGLGGRAFVGDRLNLHLRDGLSVPAEIIGFRDGIAQACQSALNSFQGTASKNFQFVSLISIVFCVA